MKITKRIENHQIKRTHKLFNFCNDITYKSKNLYNAVLYRLKEKYKNNKEFSTAHSALYKEYKHLDEFKEIGSAFSNLTIKQLSKDYKSFYKSLKSYKKDKSKSKGKPEPPNFKPSGKKGRFNAMWQANLRKDNTVKIPKHKIFIDFIQNIDKKIKQVQIEPSSNIYHREIYFNFNIIYEKEIPDENNSVKNIAGIDLGKSNLATIATNIRIKPIAINGKPLSNKAGYVLKKRKKLMKNVKGRGKSNRLRKLDKKFKNYKKNYMHNVSRKIVDWCNENNIDTIVIGKNKNWKQEINIGHRNNYHFVIIPFNMLIEQIEYKAEEYGIKTELTEEANTSKANFLNNDPIPDYDTYKKDKEKYEKQFTGRKNYKGHRGLYKTDDDIVINRDVNGAYNIIRKKYPDKIDNNINNQDLLHPIKINVV